MRKVPYLLTEAGSWSSYHTALRKVISGREESQHTIEGNEGEGVCGNMLLGLFIEPATRIELQASRTPYVLSTLHEPNTEKNAVEGLA